MTAPKNLNYRQLSQELDEILDALQLGELSIDEALAHYQRGVVIAKQLETYLKEAENRVKKVKAAQRPTA